MKKILSHIIMIVFSIVINVQAQDFDGFVLYNDGSTQFLIDKNGDIAHRWSCNARGNYASFLKENGNLVRGAVHSGNQITGLAVGGKVQEYTPDGTLVWEYVYSSSTYVSHHDITAMPDGGVMLIAWEAPPLEELENLGYLESRAKYSTHFIEVQQEGTGGKIVWEWHMKDHFIQDIDSTLANFGVIADNPQLMDINVDIEGFGGPGGPPGGDKDWFHVNGIDYSAEYDQLIFSSRFLSEIFIIDHSTTTAEAASHEGGNSGMGGDILWRWGNPDNYDTEGTRNIISAVHDSRFIPDDGRLNGGYVHIFNNEGTSGSSQIDGLILPREGYVFSREVGMAYGPAVPDWTHVCRDNANGQSASDKLPNGNTFVNLSRNYMYEVDKDENLVWQYAEGPSKAFRYTCDHPGIQSLIDQGYLDAGLCGVSSTEELYSSPFVLLPNPSDGIFTLSQFDENAEIDHMVIKDAIGNKILTVPVGNFNFDLTNYSQGVYFITVYFADHSESTKRIILSK